MAQSIGLTKEDMKKIFVGTQVLPPFPAGMATNGTPKLQLTSTMLLLSYFKTKIARPFGPQAGALCKVIQKKLFYGASQLEATNFACCARQAQLAGCVLEPKVLPQSASTSFGPSECK